MRCVERGGRKGPGGLLAKFTCGANTWSIKGGVIGTDGGLVNVKPVPKYSETFAAVGKKQEPEKLEGGPVEALVSEINGVGGGTFPFHTVLVTTIGIKVPGDLEIKAS